MRRYNTHEAKTKLSELLADVEGRREVILICRNGIPIAELRPIAKAPRDPLRKNPRLMGLRLVQDPLEPLAPEDWPDPSEE